MKRIKQISIWLIALAGLMTALGAAAQNSGNLTPSLQWNYHAGTKNLSITGTGAMPDYASHNDQPWKAFQEQIKTVTIGNGVTAIGKFAFANCTALQSVTLPAGLTTVEERAFLHCSALQNIALPAGLTTIGKSAFLGCRALQSIALPASLTAIGESAFAGCFALRSITLPARVTTIGEDAFAYCTALQQVTVAWDKPRSVPDNTFDGVNTADVTLKVPKGKEAAYQAAPVWKNFKINSPPVPGGGGKLTVSNITGSGFTVNWEKATDSDTPQNMLIYKVYCKSGNHIIFQSSDLVATLTDKTSYTITGLGGSGGISINPALGYDVNVKVVDADGSSAWYKSENVKLAAPTVAVTGVTLAPNTLTLKVGQTDALTATVAPATATNKAVTWTSSAPAIATVDASGTVKGVSPGMTTITVKTVDGGKTATATVTVKAGVAPSVTKVTGITLNYSSITVNGDLERVQLVATIVPATATDKSLTWTSSDASVASVDGAGLVTIRKKGQATVTARANDGSGVSASCLFDVIRTVANETVDGLRVYAAHGALYLMLPKAETVHIYNVEGSLVKTLTLSAGDHVQPLPSGVYLVRVGEQVTKILVK